jgi:hypothetical protein
MFRHLGSPALYGLAFFVGTLINFYGHFLVPILRGQRDPLGAFLAEIYDAPAITLLSVGIAYLFPFLVGLYSTLRTESRLLNLR